MLDCIVELNHLYHIILNRNFQRTWRNASREARILSASFQSVYTMRCKVKIDYFLQKMFSNKACDESHFKRTRSRNFRQFQH